MSQLSAAYGELGRMTESERLARKALDLERELGLRPLAMAEAARLMLALILRERGQYDEARALLNDAIQGIQAAGDREDQSSQILYFYEQALIEVAEGDARAAPAQRWSRQLDVLANCNLTLIPCGAWQGWQAHVHLLTGDLETGLRWAAQREFPHEEPYLVSE